jgi:chondroitin sulfate proteoglycan 4
MSSIAAAFSGPFKHQENPGSTWERRSSPHMRHFECQSTSSPSHSHQLLDSNRYQLMDSAVRPTTLQPLYVGRLEILTHIAVHVLSTKLHQAVHVMYVATADGLVKKISVLPRTQETCVVEIWKPFSGDHPIAIQALHFLKDTVSETGVCVWDSYYRLFLFYAMVIYLKNIAQIEIAQIKIM